MDLDFVRDYRPLREILIASGNELAATFLFKLFSGAKNSSDPQGKYQLANALWGMTGNEGKKSLQPAFTAAAQKQTEDLAFRIYSDLGSNGFSMGAFMAATCCAHGIGCALDIDQARLWQAKAEAAPDAAQFKIIENLGKRIDDAEVVARNMGFWPPALPQQEPAP